MLYNPTGGLQPVWQTKLNLRIWECAIIGLSIDANQVEGKFVGDQNKNPGAASQTLLTGGIDYICDDTQATISQCGWIAFQRFKSCSND